MDRIPSMIFKHLLKSIIMISASILSVTALSSCDSSNSSNTTTEEAPSEEEPEQINFTHAELAEVFVQNLSTDLGIELELLKIDTLQFDYIVVEDLQLFDSVLGPYYTAYFIGDYNPGESLANYIIDFDDIFHYPLDDNGDGTYTGSDGFGTIVTF